MSDAPLPTDAEGHVLKTSNDWMVGLNIVVLDPDGWDRQNFRESWMELITESEFNSRLMNSTISSQPVPVVADAPPADSSDEPEEIYPDQEPVPAEDDEQPLVPGTEDPTAPATVTDNPGMDPADPGTNISN